MDLGISMAQAEEKLAPIRDVYGIQAQSEWLLHALGGDVDLLGT